MDPSDPSAAVGSVGGLFGGGDSGEDDLMMDAPDHHRLSSPQPLIDPLAQVIPGHDDPTLHMMDPAAPGVLDAATAPLDVSPPQEQQPEVRQPHQYPLSAGAMLMSNPVDYQHNRMMHQQQEEQRMMQQQQQQQQYHQPVALSAVDVMTKMHQQPAHLDNVVSDATAGGGVSMDMDVDVDNHQPQENGTTTAAATATTGEDASLDDATAGTSTREGGEGGEGGEGCA